MERIDTENRDSRDSLLRERFAVAEITTRVSGLMHPEQCSSMSITGSEGSDRVRSSPHVLVWGCCHRHIPHANTRRMNGRRRHKPLRSAPAVLSSNLRSCFEPFLKDYTSLPYSQRPPFAGTPRVPSSLLPNRRCVVVIIGGIAPMQSWFYNRSI